MEPSGMITATATSNRATSDANLCANDDNNRASPLQTSVTEGLYSVAIYFIRFLQWFLGIIFFGPAQRILRPFNFISSLRNVPNKNPKTSRIFVINSASVCDNLLQVYRAQYPFQMNFLGIDCEWVNTKGQVNAPVALLQIATPLCDCFLIRLCKMEGQLPQTLREILQDKNILKFGVGIQDDAKKLSGMLGVNVLGCVDLRHVVQRCRLDDDDQQRNQKMSLDALAKRILGVTMDKSWRIRCSNWEAEQLNIRQIEYAMNDALVASHIFLRLIKTKERKDVKTTNVSDDCSAVERKGTGIQNVSLSFSGAYEDHRTIENESQSWSIECDADSDRPDSTMNFSDNDFTSSSQISNCFPLEGEPNITLTNGIISNLGSQVTEDRELSKESSTQENPSGNSVINSQDSSTRENDSSICNKVLKDSVDFSLVDTFDWEISDCYEVTADLNKLESDRAEGYLSGEEVTNLLQDVFLCQRVSSLCHGVTDLSFKARKRKVATKEKDKTKEHPWEKTDRKPYKRGTTRKSPLYMNCMLAAPDGSRLCTLDRKKADWYMDKGIGHLTCLDPYTVQLKFEPSGRPGTEDSYYLNFKDNICVVCGSDHSYMRKNIVPHDYRRYFPFVMKDHHSHDILLMCPDCHCLSNSYDARLRAQLANKYDAPLGNATVARLIEDPELRKVKSAAKALNHASDKLPEHRRQTLATIVTDYFNAPGLTPEMIAQASTIETRRENSNFVSHGQEVVKKIRVEGTLLEFEKMWRNHFIDTMRPQYLPPLWSVDHRHEGLKQKLENCEDS